MAQGTVAYYEITGAATVTVDHNLVPDTWFITATSPVTLSGDYNIDLDGVPHIGTSWKIYFTPNNVTLNGHNIIVLGQTLTPNQVSAGGYYEYSVVTIDGVTGAAVFNTTCIDTSDSQQLDGVCLIDETVTLAAIETGTAADIIVCDGTGNPSYVALSGDATIDNTGALTISAKAIDNSKISASAAIALSKLAPLTASKPVVTNGSGVLTTASQITAAQGGTGQDTSASTGFATVSVVCGVLGR